MHLLIWTLFVLYIMYLVLERRRSHKNRQTLTHVIHVNGTRGKSSVCRLITAGLQGNGFRVLCKTTGTDPLYLLPDGKQEAIHRIAPSNIKEQIKVLSRAARERADVLVIECMAIDPTLQQLSQDTILQADIGVITNVRLDHKEIMGQTLSDIARSLSNTVPNKGILFTAEETMTTELEAACQRRNCTFIRTSPKEGDPTFDFPENIALAAAVCEHLGVQRDAALSAMGEYVPDPYALQIHPWGEGVFINALSANDPDSTEQIYRKMQAQFHPNKCIFLHNGRSDRPKRNVDMAKLCLKLQPQEVWLIGDGKYLLRHTLSKGGYKGVLRILSWDTVPHNSESECMLFAAGNLQGQGRKLLHRFQSNSPCKD